MSPLSISSGPSIILQAPTPIDPRIDQLDDAIKKIIAEFDELKLQLEGVVAPSDQHRINEKVSEMQDMLAQMNQEIREMTLQVGKPKPVVQYTTCTYDFGSEHSAQGL